jgi:hypothetical protein
MATCFSTASGWYWGCFRISTSRRPRFSWPACLVEVAAELGEGGELAVLRQVETQRTGHLTHGANLRGPADARHRVADVDGRTTPWWNRSLSRKIWPSVIEMTFVGM